MLLTTSVTVDDEFINTIEDKEDLMEAFADIDFQIYEAKWNLAKTWMFGSMGNLSDEQQLAVAGLI